MTDRVVALPTADTGGPAVGGAWPVSLARNSAARFIADSAGLAFGMVAGVIAARWLGPGGKGLFSSLTFLASLVMQLSSLGLGDAAVVLVGQRRATLQEALSVTLFTTLCSALLGTAILWSAAVVAFGDDWDRARFAAVIACAGLPLSVLAYVLGSLLAAGERIVAESVVAGSTSAMTTLGMLLFVGALPLSLPGAVLATVLGAGIGLLLAAALLKRVGLSLRPRAEWGYLRAALRYGVPVEASHLVTLMFLRVDVLVVYSLAGAEGAGQYSVALTVAGLVGLLPMAISHATFPRTANLEEHEANQLTVRAFRFALIAAVASSLLLAATIPFAVPALFGRTFRPAVAPAMLLLAGSIVWSSQWLLCRAAAARGRPGLLLSSFTVGLIVMVALDWALVPRLGLVGAALGSAAGPAVGLAICLRAYHRGPWWPLPLGQLFPRGADLRALTIQSFRVLRDQQRRVS
ncbi:MAG: oligosaccharide flippase family protein [Nitriliruptorales bacterium]